MATRPVFIPKMTNPYVSPFDVTFTYNSGLSVSQKQKNITAIHRAFNVHFPEMKVLEISSKSMQEGGTDLSAFNLEKYVPSLDRRITVENIYHAGKVFRCGGPFVDLLNVTPREAKRDERLQSSGALTGFCFEGTAFPLRPQTLFYDYLYLNALLENEEAAKLVLEYDAFTDIEFNPQKGIACQAKSAAMFVSLTRMGLIDRVRDPESFIGLFLEKPAPVASTTAAAAEAEDDPAPSVKAGARILHKMWGEGTVSSVAGAVATVSFPSVGEKKLGVDWLVKNCSVL